MHRRDRRHARVPQAHDEVELEFELAAPFIMARQLALRRRLEVEPGRERAAVARNDDDTHILVRVELLYGREAFAHELVVERVELTRPVEANVANVVRGIGFDQRVTHAPILGNYLEGAGRRPSLFRGNRVRPRPQRTRGLVQRPSDRAKPRRARIPLRTGLDHQT